jgi:hypothetical protein
VVPQTGSANNDRSASAVPQAKLTVLGGASIEVEHLQHVLPQIAAPGVIVQRRLPTFARAAVQRNQRMVASYTLSGAPVV